MFPFFRLQRKRQEDMDIENILRQIDFSKTSLIKEPLWKKISGASMRFANTTEDSPAEPLAISLSHDMRCEETREGVRELADETLDEIAAAGLILHEESHPKTGEGEKR